MGIPVPRSGAAALVIGASSGIGAELARGLAARGHDLILVARRADRLQSLARELRDTGRKVIVAPADVSVPEDRERLVGALEREIDVLVLSAGFGLGEAFINEQPERIQLMLRTNVEATFMLARAIAPAMAARRSGAILLVSSIAGRHPVPSMGAYAATKAAVTSMGETLHWELGCRGVTVSVLAPGAVDTEFSSVAGMADADRRTPRLLKIDARACAAEALAGLDAGRRIVTPRRAVRASFWISAHLPRRIVLPLAGRALK